MWKLAYRTRALQQRLLHVGPLSTVPVLRPPPVCTHLMLVFTDLPTPSSLPSAYDSASPHAPIANSQDSGFVHVGAWPKWGQEYSHRGSRVPKTNGSSSTRQDWRGRREWLSRVGVKGDSLRQFREGKAEDTVDTILQGEMAIFPPGSSSPRWW